MQLSKVTTKGQITLPASIRRKAGVKQGDSVAFEIAEGGILIKPVQIKDKTDTPEWRKMLKASLKEAKEGRGTTHASEEEFLKSLG